MRNLYLCFLLLSAAPAYAQGPHFPWIVKEVIPTSDSTGVSHLWAPEHEAIGFILPDGTIANELSITGIVVGFGKTKDKIAVLYTTKWEEFKVQKEIHAMLIDRHTRKSVADNVIYSNSSGKLPMASVINDEQGNFQYLLIRTTEQNGNSDINASGKEMNRVLATTALTTITLTSDAKPVVVSLASAAIGADFIAAYSNRKGELSIISHANDQVVAEEFGPDGHLQKKLTAPLDFTPITGHFEDAVRGLYDPRNSETLTFAVTAYDHREKHLILSFFVFDFAAGKIPLQQSSVLDGDYRKQYKENPDWKTSRNCGKVDEQRPDGIVYTDDKLVIFTDIRYMTMGGQPGSAARFESEGAIANVFDRQYHMVHQLFLDKSYECFNDVGRGLAFHLHNGKIYGFGTELDGVAKYRNTLFVIDPDKNIASKITPDYGDGSKQHPVELAGLFWSGNFFAKYQASDKKYDGSRTNSFLMKYNYQ